MSFGPAPFGEADASRARRAPLALALFLIASACASGGGTADPGAAAPAAGKLPTITPAALAERLEGDDRPIVVDVRSIQEFRAGHIPGAVNAPYGSVEAIVAGPMATLPRDREIVLHCQYGGRAGRSVPVFQAAGFTRLVRLEGDYGAWAAAGLPAETGRARPPE